MQTYSKNEMRKSFHHITRMSTMRFLLLTEPTQPMDLYTIFPNRNWKPWRNISIECSPKASSMLPNRPLDLRFSLSKKQMEVFTSVSTIANSMILLSRIDILCLSSQNSSIALSMPRSTLASTSRMLIINYRLPGKMNGRWPFGHVTVISNI